MPFTWSEAEGELALEISAPDERAVFVEGFDAMRELLGGGPAEGAVTRPVALAGSDRAALLADFLAELAILGDTEALVPERLTDLELSAEGVRATVEGTRGEPQTVIAGATYDRLAFEQRDDGWFARAVLSQARS
jgi:SHS2 domain-containing protein